MERQHNSDPVGSLIHANSEPGGLNLHNPVHAAIVATALRQLGYCADTMALLVKALKKTGRMNYTDVRAAFDKRDQTDD